MKKQDLPISVISRFFNLPINDAARELGICVTLLKRICRKNGTAQEMTSIVDILLQAYSVGLIADSSIWIGN